MNTVAPNRKDFWGAVAKYVDSKTADQCQRKYQEDFKTPHAKGKRKNDSDAEESPFRVGKSGKVFQGKQTLKDKRKMRKLFKETQKDHYDDVFDSTPMKNMEKNMSDVELSDDEAQNKYFKNRGNTPVNTHTNSNNTGESPEILKPVNRDHFDSYINKSKSKTKKLVVGSKGKSKAEGRKSHEEKSSRRRGEMNQEDASTIAEITASISADTDEEDEDVYFSE
mmetsp:Transcript_19111/g.26741  ORF Transcript_19111/g.26741 Transcript_19111/m.26741 type:complete len:223 (-) Transcript_19111:50-718(-)